MRNIRALLCLSLSLIAAPTLKGQARTKATAHVGATKQAMTNADVVKMAKAGIAVDTIVLAIQHAKTRFDTSPDALILLSRGGVAKPVIDAMLNDASKSGGSNLANQSGVTTASADSLNNDFAKAGLRALKAIDGEAGLGSENTVPRETQALIDDADSEARLDQERAVIAVLNTLYRLRLDINRNRAPFVKLATDIGEERTRFFDTADKQPPTRDMIAREQVCSDALDFVLRNRTSQGTPKECLDLSDAGLPFQSK